MPIVPLLTLHLLQLPVRLTYDISIGQAALAGSVGVHMLVPYGRTSRRFEEHEKRHQDTEEVLKVLTPLTVELKTLIAQAARRIDRLEDQQDLRCQRQ